MTNKPILKPANAPIAQPHLKYATESVHVVFREKIGYVFLFLPPLQKM